MSAPRPSHDPRPRAVAWLARHLAIARQFVRIGLIRKSQFRLEFVNQVVMDVVFYASQILFFEFLYGHTDSIAGWTREETRVFLGFFFVADAFMMVWLGQGWHFSDDLKKGNLDPVRVRPASPIVLYFFQRFSIEGTTNMLIAFGYLGWGLVQSGFEPTPLGLAAVAWGVAVAWWGRTVTSILYSTVEFYLVSSGLSKFLEFFLTAFGERPLDIYTQRLKLFFLTALPVGALAYVPASVVLGRDPPWTMLVHTAWLTLFGLGVFRFWKRSFRRYESAMG